MTSRLRFSALCLALCSLAACGGGEGSTQTGSESGALVAPGTLPGRGVTPLVVTNVDDPLGVGDAAARKVSVVIRSAAAYRAAFGHAAPAGVDFRAGDVVIFFSDGVKPTGGYAASIVSVVQIGRALSIATLLTSPGADCIVTDALTTPYALVKVTPRGRTYNTRFQHLRNVEDCEPANGCNGFECPDGQHCELQEIVCITTPCDPIPECVDDAATPPFCGGIAGFPCPGNQLCVDDPGDDCDPNMGGADCGGICVENPCNLVDCVPGNTCEVQDGEAVCVPAASGERCGDITCGPGLQCCNPSCGICTPPDGACIQIACL